MSSGLNAKVKVGNYQLPSSAYLHIPFCRRRCFYCDFPVYVVGDRKDGNNSAAICRYLAVLEEEISITESFCQPLETVFFGGGTPSLLTAGQVEGIIEALDCKFGIAADAEISIEMDPGTFDEEKIRGYRAAGINRVSLGVQAFEDELLALCGRSHRVADIYEAIDLLHKAEIVNIGIDLISGLPQQTMERWEFSLEGAIALSPTHISCYDLIVEPKTPFARYYEAGERPLPTEEMTAQMYRRARELLVGAGYEHYEISNYARAGYQCRHNRVYWENRPYYAFGMGAASYVGGQRLTRRRRTGEYYEWVRSLQAGKETTKTGLETDRDKLLETLMLGLRLAEGLSLELLEREFGPEMLEQIWVCLQPYLELGWVEVIAVNGELVSHKGDIPHIGRLRLTAPEGFLFSNTVLAALFSIF
jgi:oxygen-independent coproporphyrinogen-3 oxidase